MFDLTPLTTWHLTFALLSFLILFAGLKIALRPGPKPSLRPVKKTAARYGGAYIVGTIAIFSLFFLTDISLRFGLLGASALVLIVGTLDELIDLSPITQLVSQLAIAAVAALSGWVILAVANPFAPGLISISFGATVLTIFWLTLLMNTLNWLDGADGLAPGVSTIAFLTLAAVSLLPSTQDRTTLGLALIGAGASLAYLLWNWPPAKVYLGTSGSWFLGLYIGLVAIRGGGKIATTLLVLALPVIDVCLVILGRLKDSRHPWQADTKRHLHNRLSALGLGPQTLTITMLSLTALLGYAAIALPTIFKLLTLSSVTIILLLSSIFLWQRQKKSSP